MAARIGIQSTTRTGHPCFMTVIKPGDPVGEWKPIQGVFIPRQCRIIILENTGTIDDLHIRNDQGCLQSNLHLRELGTYHLNQEIPPETTDEEMNKAWAEMMINERNEIVLRVTISGREYQFTTKR